MNRFIIVFFVVILLLCGCSVLSGSEDTTTESVFVPENPPLSPDCRHNDNIIRSDIVVWVDGLRLEACYDCGNGLGLGFRVQDLGERITSTWTADALIWKGWGQSATLYPDLNQAIDGPIISGQNDSFWLDSDGESWYLSLDTLSTEFGLTKMEDPENNQVFFSDIPDPAKLPTGVEIPIFRCHAVSDDIWGYEPLFLSPATMELLFQTVIEEGCTSITFEDLSHVDQIKRPVMFTFDDGYQDNYTELFPLLKKYNIKATIFVITGSVGQPHHLTEEMIREMQDSGLVSFQSHTVTHSGLSEMDGEELEYELGQSRLDLARLTGKQPFVLSCPEARNSSLSAEYITKYYSYCVYRDAETYRTGSDPYAVPRYVMPRDLTLDTFKGYLD